MIDVKINLDKFFPSEIIELHQQGLITLDDIIASERHLNAFGNELRDYVWQTSKLDGDKTKAV